MKSKVLAGYALFTCILLSACTGGQVRSDVNLWAREVSLDKWVEEELIPYLVRQLGGHPRFKGQPVLLVRLEGDNVQTRIDELTDQIRDKISDALLKEPGLDLVWRPTIQPWEHHQSLEDVSCGDYRKIRYFVGIDSSLTGVERNLYVKVRALNLAEKKWVAGFGQSWQGRPTPSQLAALGREHPDDYLRGLRPLPFYGSQPDLLASYLAHNLSCLLRQGEADDLVIFVENVSADSPRAFQTALDLVGKYLARFREVQVSDDPNKANVTVVAEIHPIHQNLFQVWLSAKHRQGQKYLPGAQTEAYVMIDAQTPSPVVGASAVRISKPVISRQKPWPGASLIRSFDLLTPLSQAFCTADSPWISGARKLGSNERLPSSSCLAIELSLSSSAHVFLIGQDAQGDLTHIFPSDCPAFKHMDAQLMADRMFRFPPISEPQGAILELDSSPGMERVYAIAITSADLAKRFALRLEEIRGLCRPAKSFQNAFFGSNVKHPSERVQKWQRYLTRVSARHPEMLQWREIRFWHDPP